MWAPWCEPWESQWDFRHGEEMLKSVRLEIDFFLQESLGVKLVDYFLVTSASEKKLVNSDGLLKTTVSNIRKRLNMELVKIDLKISSSGFKKSP